MIHAELSREPLNMCCRVCVLPRAAVGVLSRCCQCQLLITSRGHWAHLLEQVDGLITVMRLGGSLNAKRLGMTGGTERLGSFQAIVLLALAGMLAMLLTAHRLVPLPQPAVVACFPRELVSAMPALSYT